MAREEADAADLVDDINQNEGRIPIWASTYWEAFFELTNDRQAVNETQAIPGLPGASPVMITTIRELAIPFRAIDAYAERYGISGESFETFRILIRSMDQEYRAIRSEQRAGMTADATSVEDIDGN